MTLTKSRKPRKKVLRSVGMIIVSSLLLVSVISGCFLGVSLPKNGNPSAPSLESQAGANISLGNSTTITVGSEPKGMLLDPTNSLLYVANYNSDNISVINPQDNRIVANIFTDYTPYHLAYDPVNNKIYVGTDFQGIVLVVNPVNESVIGAINTDSYYSDVGVSFDPYNGMLYVVADLTNALLEINPVNNTIVNVINLDGGDGGGDSMAFVGKYIYLPINGPQYNDLVDIINADTASIVKVLHVGTSPLGATYDPNNGFVYISNTHSGNVSIINSTSKTIAGSIKIGTGYLGQISFDPDNGYSYVVADHPGAIYAINNTEVVSMLSMSTGLNYDVYDHMNGILYVSEVSNETVAGIPVGNVKEPLASDIGATTYAVIIGGIIATASVALVVIFKRNKPPS